MNYSYTYDTSHTLHHVLISSDRCTVKLRVTCQGAQSQAPGAKFHLGASFIGDIATVRRSEGGGL